MSKKDKKLDKVTKKMLTELSNIFERFGISVDDAAHEAKRFADILDKIDANVHDSSAVVVSNVGSYACDSASTHILPDSSGVQASGTFNPVHTAAYYNFNSYTSAVGPYNTSSNNINININWHDIAAIRFGANADDLEKEMWECDKCETKHFITANKCRTCGKEREVFAVWLG